MYCSLFGGSPTGADAPGPGVTPQVVAGRLQPWGLCSGLSATQWGQQLSLGPHELPPSPGPLELTLPLPWSCPAHRAVGARAPLQKPENKPTTETFWSRSMWSPITGGETPRAGRPAHRQPWMLGPQPLPLPAQKPNHSSAAMVPAVSDAPSSSGPTTGGPGLLPPAWGTPPPSPPSLSVSPAAARSGHLHPLSWDALSPPHTPKRVPRQGRHPVPGGPHSSAQQGLYAAVLGGPRPPRPLFLPAALAAKPNFPPPSFESILRNPSQGQGETARPQDLSCGPRA